MNFLAHALLTGDEPALIIGGVVGDWIKGPLPAGLPEDLAQGVALHRAIDHFAESHPAFCRSRTRVSPGRRRYAGVLADVLARMSRRIRRPNPLLHGEQELLANLGGFAIDFDEWLADTAEFCRQWQNREKPVN